MKLKSAGKPDAILPDQGGQSALNRSSELYQTGVLDKYGVKVIGMPKEKLSTHCRDGSNRG